MNHRHLRKPFRHARPLRPAFPRVGRLPLMSAAAIGAASIAAVSIGGQPGNASPAEHTKHASVLASVSHDQVGPGDPATVPAKGGAHATQAAKAEVVAARRPAAAATNPFTPPTQAPSAAAAPTESATPSTPATRGTLAAPGTPASKGAAATFGASAIPTPAAVPTKPAPGRLELYYQYQLQINGYYCGPAASRIAVSSRGHYPSQDTMATLLGTTVNGTNSVVDIARGLNAVNKNSHYLPTKLPAKPSGQQVSRLQADVVRAVSGGYPVVMNIAGTGRDFTGGLHSYPGGHYITAVGYADHGRRVKIADPAYPVGDGTYWIATSELANWAGTRGYAS